MTEYRYQVEYLSSKIARRSGWYGPEAGWTYCHWCPACGESHDYAVEGPFSNGAKWAYNGNALVPSFSPSMNIQVGPFSDNRIERCHYFLTDGNLSYCSDSTHALAGQTIPLPDFPTEQLARWRPYVTLSSAAPEV